MLDGEQSARPAATLLTTGVDDVSGRCVTSWDEDSHETKDAAATAYRTTAMILTNRRNRLLASIQPLGIALLLRRPYS
jgi:hypothetical protein